MSAVYTRDAGCGFGIDIDIPDEAADVARISVLTGNGKIVLDTFDVPRDKALDALYHPALYSKALREALT